MLKKIYINTAILLVMSKTSPLVLKSLDFQGLGPPPPAEAG
jgi:hypothetical protein